MPARPAVVARVAVFVSALALLVACGGSPTPAPSGSPAPSIATPSIDPSPSPAVTPSRGPSVEPTSPASPLPTPRPSTAPANWTTAKAVPGLEGCASVAALIDPSGTTHLAAACGHGDFQEVRYASREPGGAWKTTVMPLPANRLEIDPQLAFDGSTLYLAYSRLVFVEGGCGDDGLDDVGVWVRTRSLPSGAWSDAQQIGVTADAVESMRVANGVVHAAVRNDKDGKTYYETVRLAGGAAAQRIPITAAVGGVSLRLGDDGVPRVAFEAAGGIAYGSINGGRVQVATIPGTGRGWSPNLVLEPGNVADLLWTRSYHDPGCVEPDPEPEDGIYFSTNAGGSWHTSRVTTIIGTSSLTVDPAARNIHAVVSDFAQVVAFDRSAAGSWSHRMLSAKQSMLPVIRQDPTTGGLLVAFSGDLNNLTTVHVITKG